MLDLGEAHFGLPEYVFEHQGAISHIHTHRGTHSPSCSNVLIQD